MENLKFIKILKDLEKENSDIVLILKNSKEYTGNVHQIDEKNSLLEFRTQSKHVYIDMKSIISIEVQ